MLGVLPMAIAPGAAQCATGIFVMGVMGAATFMGVFFVPLFHVVVQLARRYLAARTETASEVIA
jgi:multidrug efflux pump